MSFAMSRAVSRCVTKSARSYADSPWGPGNPFPEQKAMPDLWRKVFYYMALPSTVLASISTFLAVRKEHTKPRPKFVKYEYMYLRTKRFPWGDGNHSLFHDPYWNALPEGYETEEKTHE